ncbi:hypothetical protein BCR33DRAFT_770148 [Rhizoclosmatium globosum]|uniref:Arrestin C-terminal-like domain-containing protein n=1 Tax=Rhizoclosmatium globosum TaxID=329046 RepID=A0A1Y2BPI5_9FUNG|nr:hypothetical protein BCR33DRAFT_770148 [Rhizoclosmatium globosum]|eukprot:ORY36659.1 hypothetical protein BCR33DRAFT_770148 [Rhizoclosmatium globosum]
MPAARTEPPLSADIASFRIELDDSDGTVFFEPSQGIQGRAIVEITRTCSIASIQVQVQGIVSGGLSHTFVGPTLSATLPQPLPLSCHRRLFQDTITLFPSSTQPNTALSPGKHTWPFSFRVPPVSILPPTYRGKMGAVRYEALALLERSTSNFLMKAVSKKLVARREIPVRSIETRQGRRALETPVFKNVQIRGPRSRGDGPVVDLAVKMPRAGFYFDEQIPFTIDILNKTATGLIVTDVAIEERVTVIYMDRSTWGPITTTRIPYPYTEHVPSSQLNESRSFRLTLPPIEPGSPHPNIAQPSAPPVSPASDTPTTTSSAPSSIPSTHTIRRRRASSSLPSLIRPSSASTTTSTSTDNPPGLNPSFQTQPLKITHHLTFRIRPTSPSSTLLTPISIDIPITLITCRRESSLLYQSESLVSLVEEVEREEEDRQRRREGVERRRSIDTLPVYEVGEYDGREDVVEISYVHPPPGYDGVGGSSEDEIRAEVPNMRDASVASGRSTLTQSYRPPGDDVIALLPFTDNNPPSFRSLQQRDGDVGGTARLLRCVRSSFAVGEYGEEAAPPRDSRSPVGREDYNPEGMRAPRMMRQSSSRGSLRELFFGSGGGGAGSEAVSVDGSGVETLRSRQTRRLSSNVSLRDLFLEQGQQVEDGTRSRSWSVNSSPTVHDGQLPSAPHTLRRRGKWGFGGEGVGLVGLLFSGRNGGVA